MKTTIFLLCLVMAQVMSSCNFSANGEDARRVQQWNPQAGERISQAEATAMMNSFKSEYPELTEGNYFDAAIYQQLIELPGAVSVVTLFGLDTSGQLKCILRAVDKDFNYLTDATTGEVITYEVGGACPPFCPPK